MISIGNNRKLTKTVGIFNLPPGITCPGATPECVKLCYAQKANKMYKSAREMRLANLEKTKDPLFAIKLAMEITQAGLSSVRFHESGDFFNQEYLDKVMNVCSMCPDVRFLAYTKSFHLDFSRKPDNLVIYWSTTDSNVNRAPAGLKAHLVMKGQQPPTGYVTCQQLGMEKHYCGSVCKICWEGKEDVYFDQH